MINYWQQILLSFETATTTTINGREFPSDQRWWRAHWNFLCASHLNNLTHVPLRRAVLLTRVARSFRSIHRYKCHCLVANTNAHTPLWIRYILCKPSNANKSPCNWLMLWPPIILNSVLNTVLLLFPRLVFFCQSQCCSLIGCIRWSVCLSFVAI